MDKQEILEKVRKIHHLCLCASPEKTMADPDYVWKVMGRIRGISEYVLEKERVDEKQARTPR